MYVIPTPAKEKAWRNGLKKMFRRSPMGAAMVELDIALDTMNTNIPINEKRGDKAQANLERRNAKSYKAAIDTLAKV